MDTFAFNDQRPTNWVDTNGIKPSVAPELLVQIKMLDGITTCLRAGRVEWKETTAFRVVQA